MQCRAGLSQVCSMQHGACSSSTSGCYCFDDSRRRSSVRRASLRHRQQRQRWQLPWPPLLLAALLLCCAVTAPQPAAAAAGCDGLSVALYKWPDDATAKALATQNRASVTPQSYTMLSLAPGIRSAGASPAGYSWANNSRNAFSMVFSGYIQVRASSFRAVCGPKDQVSHLARQPFVLIVPLFCLLPTHAPVSRLRSHDLHVMYAEQHHGSVQFPCLCGRYHGCVRQQPEDRQRDKL